MARARLCFVANSSSSSFIIFKDVLSAEQMEAILDHMEYAKKKVDAGEWEAEDFIYDMSDQWNIAILVQLVQMHTVMDNFDMYKFLTKIGVQEKDIIDADGDYSGRKKEDARNIDIFSEEK